MSQRSDDVGDRLERLLSEHRETDAEDVQETKEPEPYDPFASPAEPEGEDGEAGQKGDDLPDAPLFALLRDLAEEITVERIDRVWVFPPRRIEAGETAVVVVAAFPVADDDRRRVYAAHYTALDDAEEHRLVVDEYGTAPSDRVGRLVEEVVERIKEGPADAPRSARIEGEESRWDATLHELAEAYLDERQRNRRLR
ncbi:MAG: hypothetical protein R3314_01605 [Longimicrobiales bacterium]|nr:hypothetical protein [Longimicrobiales bacterium]